MTAAVVALAWTTPFSQVAIIAGGAVIGRLVLAPPSAPLRGPEASPISRRVGIVALVIFALLLLGLPLLRGPGGQPVALFDSFYRAGALVFGGGHVVLPLLHATVVDPGWVSDDRFLAGYGMAQAVPGPLFTFAGVPRCRVDPGAQRGPGRDHRARRALPARAPPGLGRAAVLGFAAGSVGIRRALTGTNAAVVGILVAALYTPVWTSAIVAPVDVAVAAGALALLLTGRVPPIVVVGLCALAGQALGSA